MILERERRGRTEILTLNRPEARNAMSPELSLALDQAFDEIDADPDVRVVVITGNGPVFCAGADLKVVAGGGGARHQRAARRLRRARVGATSRSRSSRR